jgi:DNA-binding NarL/FixJ family response regulator
MQTNKFLVGIAEDKKEDMDMIKAAVESIPNYKVIITASGGRDLILQVNAAKVKPHLVLMDMQMPCCDGLLSTIIYKNKFAETKVVGLSTHTYSKVINEFMAEGGDGFLSKFIVMKESAINMYAYKDPNIFEKALNKIMLQNEIYFDELCHYKGEDYKRICTTKKIIQSKFKHLSQEQILLLQLNAGGFKQEDCAKMLNVEVPTIKKYLSKLMAMFQAKSHNDLSNISVMFGITKYFTLYQDFDA